jgi:hypothetical protein
VPTPPGIALNGPEAERKAGRLIRVWFQSHKMQPPDNYVLRTYLARSNDFKVWVRDSGMNPAARQAYLGKGMPRWVWVTEISQIEWMNQEAPERRLIRGEVLIDATSSPWTDDFLAFHIIHRRRGFFYTMSPSDEDAEAAMRTASLFSGERPYKYLGRHIGGR